MQARQITTIQMTPDIRHLQSFLVVAETLNFSRAAEKLNLSQPALSRTIQDLEDRLGCKLFERTSGKVNLNEAGTALLKEAKLLLKQMDALMSRMAEYSTDKKTTLVLAHFGTLIAIYLGPFLIRLRKRFPSLEIELKEIEPIEGIRSLHEGKLECVICGKPSEDLVKGLNCEIVYREPPLLILPSAHLLAKKRRLGLSELSKESWAVWKESSYPGMGKPFIEACNRAGFAPKIVKELDSVSSVFDGVAQGNFVSYVGSLARSLPRI